MLNPTPINQIVKRWTNILLSLLFGVLLWSPTFDTFFHSDHTPAFNENRKLAQFPKFKSGYGNAQEYIVGLQSYFNDHFGYRKKLILWHTELNHDLFRDSGVPKVLIGKDDWLYWADDQMVEHYRGIDQFTEQQLESWKTLLEYRRDWLARRGIKYIFVVAPDKQSIYPEYLPNWMTKIRPETKLDQFFAYMQAHSTVEVVDLRPTLLEGKRLAPTYFKTDTHWNYLGGFLASEEIIKSLSSQIPGLRPLSLGSFELQRTTRPGGDLAKFLGLNDLIDDTAVSLKPKSNLPVLGMNRQVEDRPGIILSTTNSMAHGNVIIFRDSFGFYLEPFLGYHFHKATYIWQYELDTNWIDREKPGVVISEMVERNFNITNPQNFMELNSLK